MNHCPFIGRFRLGPKRNIVITNDNKIKWVKEEEIKIKLKPEDSLIHVPLVILISPMKITKPSPEVKFPCNQCNLSYSQKSSLGRHVRNKHTNISK